MSRDLRPIALLVITLLSGSSVAGCGAPEAVLGVQEPPKANPASAPLGVDLAKRILTRDFTAAQQGEATKGAAARAALGTAYTGAALRAAKARIRLAALQPAGADSHLLTPQQPLLLAVPRGFGFPRAMVAQTVASKGSLPVLHLLTSPDAMTPYRISASATMLPASSVKPFHPLTQGSPLVSDGAGMAVGGDVLLKAYVAGMEFPAKAMKNPPFAPDIFSAQVRAKARSVAKAVSKQATFSQVHQVVPSSVYAVRQAGGGALVFAVIERTDSFKVKSGQAVNTSDNKEFVLLSGEKRVTRRASITWLEFVVFSVPAAKGKATLVAASEQVVAGSGT